MCTNINNITTLQLKSLTMGNRSIKCEVQQEGQQGTVAPCWIVFHFEVKQSGPLYEASKRQRALFNLLLYSRKDVVCWNSKYFSEWNLMMNKTEPYFYLHFILWLSLCSAVGSSGCSAVTWLATDSFCGVFEFRVNVIWTRVSSERWALCRCGYLLHTLCATLTETQYTPCSLWCIDKYCT